MSYENLPQTVVNKIDGKLTPSELAAAKEILVLGTSNKGNSESYEVVLNPSAAAKTFGYDGNLVRGTMEAFGWGGKNFRCWRYGGTACKLSGIGATASGVADGIVIETINQDATEADDFTVYWDNTNHELYVWDDSTVSANLIYHRDFEVQPGPDLDAGIVSVTGTYVDGEGVTLGTAAQPSSGVDFTAPGVSSVLYTAGTDGTEDGGPCYMKKYELLQKAYKMLENEAPDYVVPMDVYMDVPNVADTSTLFSTYAGAGAYPTTGSPLDGLGKLYTEEYLGVDYFWWDLDGDGVADIYPSAGSADATHTCTGEALTVTDFREVNFAYQLAYFCYTLSENSHETLGMIGVLPPTGVGQSDVINWLGKAPVYSLNDDQEYYVANAGDNGTGLLGNKFMAGKSTYRSGVAYGGFILTADGFPSQANSVELTDDNDHLIDIGKHISIVSGWNILNTPWDTTGNGYMSNMSAVYAGFDSALPPGSASTNKTIGRVRLPFKVNLRNLDAMSRFRYVMTGRRQKGVVWVDAPTAARPDSDYQRQSTVRVIRDILNDIRVVCDPFIGEANSALQRAALQTQIDGVIGRYVHNGLKGGICTVSATIDQELRGEASVELVLVPEFELRRILITMSLAATL